MRRIRSLGEILASRYISKTEIQREFGQSYKTASRIYELALKKDRQELKGRLIYPNGEMVRISSVCWVVGIEISDLKSGLTPSK